MVSNNGNEKIVFSFQHQLHDLMYDIHIIMTHVLRCFDFEHEYYIMNVYIPLVEEIEYLWEHVNDIEYIDDYVSS